MTADHDLHDDGEEIRYWQERGQWECPYCFKKKPSYNGTGSDVSCCGEVGHAVKKETDETF
jgi:hypothetical protein